MAGDEPGKGVAIAKLGVADQLRLSHASPSPDIVYSRPGQIIYVYF